MFIFLDVETKKTFAQVNGRKPELLEASFVGTFIRSPHLPQLPNIPHIFKQYPNDQKSGIFIGFFESAFNYLWPLLQKASLIIGYNSLTFDYPVLKPYYSQNLSSLPSFDILHEIKKNLGFRISLDHLAQQTLGTQKSGSGLDAVHYYHTQQYDKLARYCLDDVKITRDLFDHIQAGKPLIIKDKWNHIRQLTLTIPQPKTPPQIQTSLF